MTSNEKIPMAWTGLIYLLLSYSIIAVLSSLLHCSSTHRVASMLLRSTSLSVSTNDGKSSSTTQISSALSIIFFSVVLFLVISSFHLLLRAPLHGFQKMRLFLLVFTTFMLCLSSITLISILTINFGYKSDILAIYSSLCRDSFTNWWCRLRKLENYCVTATIWAADWFMIWRCMTLYQGVSDILRRMVIVFCSTMWLLSFGIGLVFIIPMGKQNFFLILISSTTLFINVVITTLIVGRLLHHRYMVREAFGHDHRSPYLRVVVLFIESASLVVVFNIILLIFVVVDQAKHTYPLIPVQLTVQIYAMSPLLIIFKVAYDRVYPPDSMQTQDALAVVDRETRMLEFEGLNSSQSIITSGSLPDSRNNLGIHQKET